MLDNTGDWCFEGGCTYVTNTDIIVTKEEDSRELEAIYGVSCEARYD